MARASLAYDALLACLLTVIMTGCSAIKAVNGQYRVDEITSLEVEAAQCPGALRSCIKLVDIGDVRLNTANSNTENRNALQNELIRTSDAVCEVHKAGVLATASTNNVAAGVLTTALTTVSSIVTGQAARNYAASAAIVSGSNAQIRSEIYMNLLTSAIVSEIQKIREQKLAEIAKRQKDGIENYDAQIAVRDALDYHYGCSMYKGLLALTSKDGVQQETFEQIKSKLAYVDERIARIDAEIGKKPSEEQKKALEAERLNFKVSQAHLALRLSTAK